MGLESFYRKMREFEWVGEEPPDRPYVFLNMVTSVDGRATVGGRLVPGSLGSKIDRRVMDLLRARADLVLMGGGTLRAHPFYPSLDPELVLDRRRRGQTDQPRLGTVSRSLGLPWESPGLQNPPLPPVVLLPRDVLEQGQPQLSQAIQFVGAGGEGLDLQESLRILYTQGIRSLLLEGGPHLNHQFFSANLVDEIFWTIAPRLVGSDQELSMVQGADALKVPRQLRLIWAVPQGDEVYMRYQVMG